MFPNPPADRHPASGRRRRHATVIIALSASLLGVSAVTTASAANDGTTGSNAAAQEVTAGVTSALIAATPAAVHGAAEDGTEFNGTFTLERFKQHAGTLFAVGQLDGTLGDRPVSRPVSLPVTGGNNDVPDATTQPHGFAAPAQATPGACPVLNLDLAPIDLNLLGLRVFLDEVHLLIEAIPAPGDLLGNLLCAVTGLLDGGLLGGPLGNLLSSVTALLNALLGAL